MKWNEDPGLKRCVKLSERRAAQRDRDLAEAREKQRKLAIRNNSKNWKPSRRGFLAGIGLSAIAVAPALANTPFTSFGYPIGGNYPGSINRFTQDRFADWINVAEFGPDLTGHTDASPAIKQAMSAAFFCSEFTASISGSTLTASSVVGTILIGNFLANQTLSPLGLQITAQTGGTTGGNGTYTLSASTGSGFSGLAVASIAQQNSSFEPYKSLYFPAGAYSIGSPINIVGVANARILGDAAHLICSLDGSQGNILSPDFPTVTPIWCLDGFENMHVEGIGFGWANNTNPFENLNTSASTSSGSAVLHFASSSVPSDIKPGWTVWNATNPASASIPGASGVVASTTSSTVTLAGNVGASGVANQSSIVFISSSCAIAMTQLGGGQTTASTFQNCTFDNMALGIIAGSSGGNCDNMMLVDCTFRRCAWSAVRLVGQNVINWTIMGGGAAACSYASTFDPFTTGQNGNEGAAYSFVSGVASQVIGQSFSSNGWDVLNFSGQQSHVMGGSTEQAGQRPFPCTFTYSGITSSPFQMVVTSVSDGVIQSGTKFVASNGKTVYVAGSAGGGGAGTYALLTFDGSAAFSASGATVTSPGVLSANCFAVGDTIVSGYGIRKAVPGILPEASRAFDLSLGGIVSIQGIQYSPPVQSGDVAVFIAMAGNSSADVTGVDWADSFGCYQFKATGGAADLWVRNMHVEQSLSTSLWSNFTGNVRAWEAHIDSGPLGVSDMTIGLVGTYAPANARWKHAKLWVSDCTTAWSSGAIGTNISGLGGGSNTVPIICPSGSSWVIGA